MKLEIGKCYKYLDELCKILSLSFEKDAVKINFIRLSEDSIDVSDQIFMLTDLDRFTEINEEVFIDKGEILIRTFNRGLYRNFKES